MTVTAVAWIAWSQHGLAQAYPSRPVRSPQTIVTQTPDPPPAVHEHKHPPVELAQPGSGPITTAKDAVPDFAGAPTITSMRSGRWSDAATWGGRKPAAADVVRIAAGHEVIFDGADEVAALGIGGTLTFATAASTRLKAGVILVYRSGRLHVGTPAAPVKAKAEIVIANRPLDAASDPLQFGTGLVAFGEVIMHGSRKTPTWLRLAKEPRAGDTTLVVDGAPAGWQAGDRLVLPDTRQTPLVHQASAMPVPLQIEEPLIARVAGNRITLTTPLNFSHLAGRDSEGTVVALPHAGNLSRNVVVRSEDPGGTRGHVMFTERARVAIQYAAFEHMGRTTAAPLGEANQIGRYPVHFHHLMGPRNPGNAGHQFVFSGNSVVDALKWAIAIHNAHWGLVRENVVYGAEGAAIMTEQGNERENVIEKNFAVRIGTMINTVYHPTYGGGTGRNKPLDTADFGWEGSAYWFNGNDNYVRHNVAANVAYAGIMYNARSPSGFAFHFPLVPRFRGAEIGAVAEWDNHAAPRRSAPEIRESSGNEVYASAVGTWIGFSGRVGTLKDSLHWNIRQQGVYAGRNAAVAFENFKIFADQEVSNRNGALAANTRIINKGMDFEANVYNSGGITVRNSRIEGFNLGLSLPANTTPMHQKLFAGVPSATVIDGITLRNYVNILESSPFVAKHTIIRNPTMALNPGPPNKALSLAPANLVSVLAPNAGNANLTALSRTLIFNYKGKDLEFFFPEQAPDFVMLARANKAANCPTAGLTNQQCWERHQVATMGRLATCGDTTTYPELRGFVCPLTDPPATFDKVLAGLR